MVWNTEIQSEGWNKPLTSCGTFSMQAPAIIAYPATRVSTLVMLIGPRAAEGECRHSHRAWGKQKHTKSKWSNVTALHRRSVHQKALTHDEQWYRGIALDWSRLCLQMLFVDSVANGLPSRLAEACMRRVADWNGGAWLFFTDSAGLDAVKGAPSGNSFDSVPAQCALAHSIGLDTFYFSKGGNRLHNPLDLFMHDVIFSCTTDDGMHEHLLDIAHASTDNADGAVLRLCDFAWYLSRDELLECDKASAPLPEDLARWLRCNSRLERARDAGFAMPAVTGATLASADGEAESELLMASTLVSIAGLTAFLLRTCPVEYLERKYFPE